MAVSVIHQVGACGNGLYGQTSVIVLAMPLDMMYQLEKLAATTTNSISLITLKKYQIHRKKAFLLLVTFECKEKFSEVHHSNALPLILKMIANLACHYLVLKKFFFLILDFKLKDFACSIKSTEFGSSQPLDKAEVKLPKLNVPTFDGNILNWNTFWKQFCVKNVSNVEKLVYLYHALKGGSAKLVIEGLSRSGEQYQEAISCPKSRYDCSTLIH